MDLGIANKLALVTGSTLGIGRAIAEALLAEGARVIVTEIDPVKAIEAVMDGYRVMPLTQAASISDFIVTATGDKNVVGAAQLAAAKDGCVLANAGHFNVEIDLAARDGDKPSDHAPVIATLA